MTHRLDPLLRPGSVAVLGASSKPDSMGEWALANLDKGGFTGSVYPVNPGYRELAGRRCYAELAELPEVPSLVIFAIGDRRIEEALDDAIGLGVPAAVIMSPLALDEDSHPPLKDRVRQRVSAAGMLVCGANGMGFYNVRDRVWACGFDSADHEPPGSVAIISHSGAGMSGIIDCEARLAINFAVSTGNELSVTMDQYLDFVLDLPETRAIGLFIESIRRPDRFVAALGKAAARQIPIVALKTGRTEEAAAMTVSHSGALAGDDAVFDAVFERFGVQRVRDQDEWTTALIMLDALHPVGDGGLVTLHDSGGERQLIVDLAAEAGVPLSELSGPSRDALTRILPPELPAVNPLDAWSRGGTHAAEDMATCFSLLLGDPGAALGAVVHNRAPYGKVYASYLGYLERAAGDTGKPVALVSARQGSGHDDLPVAATRRGLPVLDGVWPFLVGVRSLFACRDFFARSANETSVPDDRIVARWRKRLRSGAPDEALALAMLEDFGISTAQPAAAGSLDEVLAAARAIGYPVALKSAQPGLAHKSDVGGVCLDLGSDEALRDAYRRMSRRLGPRVIVAAMIADGVEMLLGARNDPQFGPVVVLGFGGVLAETLGDVVCALAPFGPEDAQRYLDGLRLRPLLDGVRGKPAVDTPAFCRAAADFSALVYALAGVIDEIDVNPVIATPGGAIAADALVVPARGSAASP